MSEQMLLSYLLDDFLVQIMLCANKLLLCRSSLVLVIVYLNRMPYSQGWYCMIGSFLCAVCHLTPCQSNPALFIGVSYPSSNNWEKVKRANTLSIKFRHES